MSAFAAVFRRDGAPRDDHCIDTMLDAMAHRGPDGCRIVRGDNCDIGVQHFWTTPEDVGCTQPLTEHQTGVQIAFAGRIDNRRELARLLDIQNPELTGLSDPQLFLKAFLNWQHGVYARILGPFASVVYEGSRRRFTAARDLLGDRPCVYFLGPRLALVASEECALLRHASVSDNLDPESMARFFSVRPPASTHSFFADISTLPPGHLLTVSPEHTKLSRYGAIENRGMLNLQRDEEYVEQYRELLSASIESRMRARESPVVQMSGGLDSTSVAALAQNSLNRPRTSLRTISWVFKTIPTADERPYIDAMIDGLGLDGHRIEADTYWPLKEKLHQAANPNAPWDSLYRGLSSQTYAAAHDFGSRVLLDGLFGDQLYMHSQDWLRDLLARGRFSTALGESRTRLTDGGFPVAARLRDFARSLVVCLGLPPRPQPPPPWLTPLGRSLLESSEEGDHHAHHRGRGATLLDPIICHSRAIEATYAAHHQIELRSPYRDRRLIEFVLTLPSDLLERRGWSKWILRKAMTGVLPEEVRLRWWQSSFIGLCMRGLIDEEQERARHILDNDQALWREYVRHQWIAEHVPEVFGCDDIRSIVAWNCICIELWRNRNTP